MLRLDGGDARLEPAREAARTRSGLSWSWRGRARSWPPFLAQPAFWGGTSSGRHARPTFWAITNSTLEALQGLAKEGFAASRHFGHDKRRAFHGTRNKCTRSVNAASTLLGLRVYARVAPRRTCWAHRTCRANSCASGHVART